MHQNNLFGNFMIELGAKPHVLHASPFDVYFFDEQKILIHFIDLQKFEGANLALHFFTDLTQKTTAIHHKIIHVWEDVWLTNQATVRSRIKSILGYNKKIHARQTQVIRLDKLDTTVFLNENHLQKATGAYYKFGLKWQEQLVAVATFSKARTMYDGPVYYRSFELERFATLAQTNVVGGFSKLVNYFSKNMHAQHIMTYADRDWSQGESYSLLGFNLIEETEPQQFFINKNTHQRTIAHQLATPENCIKVWNAGSLKFVLNTRAYETNQA